MSSPSINQVEAAIKRCEIIRDEARGLAAVKDLPILFQNDATLVVAKMDRNLILLRQMYDDYMEKFTRE